LANALKMSLMTEIELYSHMTDEEFELIRLNKQERRQEILKSIKVRIFDSTFGVIQIDGIEMISCNYSFPDNLSSLFFTHI